MAQLTWNQVSAPDLSGTSNILRNANASFNAGLSNASALLNSYNEGQQEKNDNALLGDIASLNSEEELSAFLSGDALKNKNISATMRENILGLRNGILANESTRAATAGTKANTANTYARTAIAQASEGRQAAEYQDGVNARTELRGLTGAVVGANTEGNQIGFTRDAPASLVVTESGGNFGARNNATGLSGRAGHFGRVQFGRDRFDEAVRAGVVPKGMTIEQFGSNTSEAKRVQKQAEDWHFADIQQFIDDENLSNHIGKNMGGVVVTRDGLVAMAHLGGKNGMRRFLETKGLYNPADDNGTQLSDYLKTHAGNSTAQTGNRPPPSRMSVLQNAIAQSVYLTPDQATSLLGDAYKAQSAGQTRIDSQQALADAKAASAEAAARNERSAAAILSGIQDPNIVSGSGLTNNLLGNESFQSDTERLAAVERGAGIANGPLSSTLRPGVAPDAVINATVQQALAADQRGLDALPQTVILERANRFEDNPTQSLIDELSLGSDGNNPQTFLFGMLGENFDEVDVTRKINEVARSAGVSPAMAAAGMVEKFKRDPFKNNTLDRRFVEDEIVNYIKETMSPEAMTRYGNEQVRTQRRSGEIEGATLQLNTLRAKAAKYPEGEVPAGLQTQINNLRDTLATGSTPQEVNQKLRAYLNDNRAIAETLQGVEPERRALILTNRIQADSTLSQSQKTQLILAINGG